ncbi:MAG: NapH/MauN family ferredoxin-type protein [Sulfurovum sp.]|nr:NapH/MauN family ferredoxin-type protein [Sulfurovum sp.]MCB4745042.1 NapH/MauN family ferredoxin-type protein [Sulfurovum sp.]MCB4746667.1 NapH/MauN family ferredoxin-type protein [Sulfurovum sp.]MCB4748048.1 NapH/MauN family ferredoxin-type protein [Sulfurovum sp.]MCB4749922.1 NapH/MauN family ferredoxin-type protein [Sulfurovum sp.]
MDKYNSSVKKLIDAPFLSTLYYKNCNGKYRLTIRAWRWLSIFVINFLFFLSFHVDMQVLEGTLNGSRLLGFHLIDPFTALEIFAAEYHFHINVIIGSMTLIIFYFLVGGKAYCAWVCPYGFLSEIGERIHQILVRKKTIKGHKFNPNVRFIFWVIFLVAAIIDGYLVFEVINPIGYLSRVITYGWSLAIVWVLVILLIEIFYSRRAWCKYVCPVGTTYNLIGWASMTKVQWDMNKCDHCGACLNVCFEDHVLEFIKPKYDKERTQKGVEKQLVINGDCTLCGRCFDVCHTDAYHYEFRLKDFV